MRLSRPCYDKPHRCPGWAGGGIHRAKVDRCYNGSIRTRVPYEGYPGEFHYPGSKKWRFGHCNKCDIVTWPVVTRWLDPGWWKWVFHKWTWRYDDWKYERQWKKENRS